MSQRIQWLSTVRVSGLLLVLAYHFFRDSLPGGFVGVDVFFTLSGYLTTALLIEEFRKSGGFKLWAFCKRRFLRIFPPLAVSLMFTLPFALLVAPDYTAGIARQAAGTLGFVTNYFEIFSGGSYEAQLLPHLYVHTWSLALEMHYYLVWGLACFALIFLIWWLVKKQSARLPMLKGCIIAISLGLAALCYWQMRALFAAYPEDPSAAYFASTSHGMPFFIGSAAGALFGMRLPEKAAKRLRSAPALTLSLLAMLLSAGGLVYFGLTLGFAGEATYRYGFVAASLLTALLIFGARALHEATAGVKEPRALTVLAELSYGIFLYHWPLYVVFSDVIERNWLAALAALALSVLFSAVVYYGIESLLHDKKLKPLPKLAHRWDQNAAWKVFYPAVAALTAAALGVGTAVLIRAPQVTAMEQSFLNGHAYQDAQGIEGLRERVLAIQPQPAKVDGKALAYGDASQNPAAVDDDWTPSVVITSIPGGVSFLGDSVALAASRPLRENVPNITVDSAESRSMAQGRQLLRDLAAADELKEYVVVSLGANGYGNWQAQIDGMIEELPPGHRLIFVTPYLGKPQAGIADKEIAAYYRQMAQKHPFVTVADWAVAIAPHQDLLAPDRIHFGNWKKCGQIYVDMLLEAIEEAGRKPAKGE